MSYFAFDSPFDFLVDTRDYDRPLRASRRHHSPHNANPVASVRYPASTHGHYGNRRQVSVPITSLSDAALAEIARRELERRHSTRDEARRQAEAERAAIQRAEQQEREEAYRQYLKERQRQWEQEQAARAARAEARARRERALLEEMQRHYGELDPFERLVQALSPFPVSFLTGRAASPDVETPSASESEAEEPRPKRLGSEEKPEPETKPEPEADSEAESERGAKAETVASDSDDPDVEHPSDIERDSGKAEAAADVDPVAEQESPVVVPKDAPQNEQDEDQDPLDVATAIAQAVSEAMGAPIEFRRPKSRKASAASVPIVETPSEEPQSESSKPQKAKDVTRKSKDSKDKRVSKNKEKARQSPKSLKPHKRTKSNAEEEEHQTALLEVLSAETQHLTAVYMRLRKAPSSNSSLTRSHLRVLEDTYQRAERIYTQLDGLRVPKTLRKPKHDLTTQAVELADRLESAITTRREVLRTQTEQDNARNTDKDADWSETSSDASATSSDTSETVAPTASIKYSTPTKHHVMLETVRDESE